ncbi:MAG: pantetheine-phosphate adenylyltransferase [Clostridia bacterium]|nr:pantetheine-phosphate adenylyltransferase [Clostridia bacterium]
MKIAVVPGSFDPITKGHLDIIKRTAKIFDKVIVAVLTNSSKSPTFTKEERVEFIRSCTEGIDNVEVDSFSGLLADYTKNVGACAIVKGLRAMSDFEYEFQMALTNKKINRDVETMFLTTSYKYLYLSSSIVKEITRNGGDISEFVPEIIHDKIVEKFK